MICPMSHGSRRFTNPRADPTEATQKVGQIDSAATKNLDRFCSVFAAELQSALLCNTLIDGAEVFELTSSSWTGSPSRRRKH